MPIALVRGFSSRARTFREALRAPLIDA